MNIPQDRQTNRVALTYRPRRRQGNLTGDTQEVFTRMRPPTDRERQTDTERERDGCQLAKLLTHARNWISPGAQQAGSQAGRQTGTGLWANWHWQAVLGGGSSRRPPWLDNDSTTVARLQLRLRLQRSPDMEGGERWLSKATGRAFNWLC